jgi:hypothetical protein
MLYGEGGKRWNDSISKKSLRYLCMNEGSYMLENINEDIITELECVWQVDRFTIYNVLITRKLYSLIFPCY